jgi:hypothetical protein
MTRGQGETAAAALQARVRELLDYDPETGIFLWKVDRTNGRGHVFRAAGSEAGYIAALNKTNYYRQIMIDGRTYRAHRLAWLYMTGSWPANGIDHADGDGTNNSWCNLREATRSENGGNSRRRSDNVSGAKGVRLDRGKWVAQITVAGKICRLGTFNTLEAAAAAYEAAAIERFGEFART